MSLSPDDERFCASLAQEAASSLATKCKEICVQNGSTHNRAADLLELFLSSLRREFHSQIDSSSTSGGVVRRSSKGRGKKSFRLLNRKSSGKETSSVQKEGILRQLIDAGGASLEWSKCRVVLLRSSGGNMIEFYSPPKVR